MEDKTKHTRGPFINSSRVQIDELQKRIDVLVQHLHALEKDHKRKIKKLRLSQKQELEAWKKKELNLCKKISSLKKENMRLNQENSFIKHKSCGRKVTYEQKIAQLWASERKQRAYKCKYCNGWVVSQFEILSSCVRYI